MRLIAIVMVLSSSLFARPIRETIQLRNLTRNPALFQHTFGLSQRQRQAVFEMSGVDLRFHYYRDSLTHSILALLSPNAFRGFIHFDVPPPWIGGEIEVDPELAGQYWIEKLQVPAAWELATGKGVTIADCDSGYYTEESDIAPNLLVEHRYDLSDSEEPFNVSDGPWVTHGTSVTAILAGVKDKNGTQGIAYDAKVVPLQNFNYSSNDKLDKEEATARCVLRAITIQHVKVLLLENQTATGSSETFAGTREAVKLALKAGITVVSAAGNYSAELLTEAENDTNSIIVGAVTKEGKKASWSNYGARISVAAFGEELKTLSGPNGQMYEFGGTSGATPQVAATVALMLEVNSKLTPDQVKKILIETRAESLDTKDVGGLLNTLAAVQKAKEFKVEEKSVNECEEFIQKLRDILMSH